MGLENSTTISGLDENWPLGTDPRSQGDDHLRLIKAVLKRVFDDTNGTGDAGQLVFKDGAGNVLLTIQQDKVIGRLAAQPTSATPQLAGFQINDSAGRPRNRMMRQNDTIDQLLLEVINPANSRVQLLNIDAQGGSFQDGTPAGRIFSVGNSPFGVVGKGWVLRMPNGLKLQTWAETMPTGQDQIFFPESFASGCFFFAGQTTFNITAGAFIGISCAVASAASGVARARAIVAGAVNIQPNVPATFIALGI